MIINEIAVGRKFNLGNFEMLDIKVSVSPERGKDFQEDTDWEKLVEDVELKLNSKIKSMRIKLMENPNIAGTQGFPVAKK